MTWTYNPALRLTVPLFELRFTLGDTDKKAQQFSDEDLQYLLDRNGQNVRKAAWKAAEAKVAELAKRIDVSAGPVKVPQSQRFQQWRELADRLKREYLFPGGGRLTSIGGGASALVHPNALNNTKLGPKGTWQSVLKETGTGGGE